MNNPGYFNLVRSLYSQTESVFTVPTIVAGKITFGIFTQITNAFGQVSGSFQYTLRP